MNWCIFVPKMLRMWFNRQSVTLEPEPIETPADKLAHAEAEVIFSSAAYDESVRALREYNVAHGQNAFAFTVGAQTTVQTFVHDATRRRLEKEVRQTMARRNAALAERADLMLHMGLIR